MLSERSELAKKIFQTCYLTGDFILRSGLRSDEYFDKYAMESSPELLTSVTEHLIPLIPEETELLAALEMGGIPLGTALSLKTKIPVRFVRKKAKQYGTMRICEGGDVKNQKLCIIEDVITTGGQVIESTKALRDAGAFVSDVLCVIFRGNNTTVFKKESLKLSYLFNKEDLTSFQRAYTDPV